MRKLIVDKKFENKKLSVFLQATFDGLSINTIYKALRKKDIIVNDIRVTDNIALHTNDSVTIYITDDLLYKKINIDIVYEDDFLVVVNKPVDIEVITNSPDEQSFTDFLREYYKTESKDSKMDTNFPAPCHRLDRNTGGLVLFAKNEISEKILLDKFKKHEIERHYSCMVYGIPKKEKDTLTAYLRKDSKKSLVYISDEPANRFSKDYYFIHNIIKKQRE